MELTLEQIQNFKGKYPKQLWSLFTVEMWERFCFYGMRGVLTYFMVDQLLLKDDVANLQYGAIQAFVYAFTFIGGIFADKILGFKNLYFWRYGYDFREFIDCNCSKKRCFIMGLLSLSLEQDFLNLTFLLWLRTLSRKMIPEEMQVTECSMQELILADF